MNVGGPLTLSGSGTYIFRAVGALDSTAGAVVTLSDGASACDVFWTPSAATTLGANTNFSGTVIDDAGITVGANTTWEGRALAFGGTITTDTDTITVPNCTPAPATLHVVKEVVNNSGGSALAADFNLHVKLSGADVLGSPAVGLVSPGRSYTLAAGTYVVSEDANASYAQIFSGDCNASGSVTLAAGAEKTCTMTNDDIAVVIPPATINVVKTVINDNGGILTVGDFPLFVNGVSVVSGETNVFAAPATYTVTETSDADYTQAFSGDCDADGNVDLTAGDNWFCIITNNDIAAVIPPTSSRPPVSGIGPALPLVPPLIDVVKVPSPLALPDGPGLVNYTYTLRNIGTVAVTNITMVGDTCSPITLFSGDLDGDARLDVNETWQYRCSTTLAQTHTNTIVATGWANGLSAVDIASATVIVGIPIVPPLIHVTKIPSPLILPFGGGVVTYTATITNPGVVALTNVRLTDDTCSPMIYLSGDENGDGDLDPVEEWRYTCQTTVTETTTNTAIATGEANGIEVNDSIAHLLIARDFAIAPVVVLFPATGASNVVVIPGLADATFAPGLPDAGFGLGKEAL